MTHPSNLLSQGVTRKKEWGPSLKSIYPNIQTNPITFTFTQLFFWIANMKHICIKSHKQSSLTPTLPLSLHCFQSFQRHQQSIPSIQSKGWLYNITNPRKKDQIGKKKKLYINILNKNELKLSFKKKKRKKNELRLTVIHAAFKPHPPSLLVSFSTLWYCPIMVISFYMQPKALLFYFSFPALFPLTVSHSLSLAVPKGDSINQSIPNHIH